MEALLRDLTGWLSVLPALGGAGVCALHARRSGWVALMAGGFGLETLVSLFYRLASMAMARGGLTPTRVGIMFLLASLVGFLARTSVVVGLAGLLSHLWAGTAPAGGPPPGAQPDAQ